MTGFGTGESPLGAGKLIVEIRGVNHRFLDLRVRVPRELQDIMTFVEHLARDRFNRGRFEMTLRLEGIVLSGSVLDRDRAKGAYKAFCDLRDELAPGAEVPLSLLNNVPDLYVSAIERDLAQVREAATIAFEHAAEALNGMRLREGRALTDDLVKRVQTVRTLARHVEGRAPDVIEAHRRRLRERAERLRASIDVECDVGRMEQEIAVFAERIDICEELTRLESHCVQLSSLLVRDEAVGRRLDFLLQEMAREVNTVGAKSADAQVSHAVVEVKAEIERMREQVQNIE